MYIRRVQVSELRETENASIRPHRPIVIMTQPLIMLQNVVHVTHHLPVIPVSRHSHPSSIISTVVQ